MKRTSRKLLRWASAVLAVFALVVLSGCQSLAGSFGIATQQYVDDKMTETEGRLSAKIDENRSKLEEYETAADKLEELINSVEGAVRTTDELKQLAGVLEERLNSLPEETIRQLVDVLQQYLDEK